MNPNSTKKLKRGPDVVVAERTGKYKVVGGGLVPDTTESSSRTQRSKFPNAPEVVPGTTDVKYTNNHIEVEEQPSKSPVSDEPVDENLSLTIKKKYVFRNHWEKKDFERACTHATAPVSEEQRELALTLISSATGENLFERCCNALRQTGVEIEEW